MLHNSEKKKSRAQLIARDNLTKPENLFIVLVYLYKKKRRHVVLKFSSMRLTRLTLSMCVPGIFLTVHDAEFSMERSIWWEKISVTVKINFFFLKEKKKKYK